MYIEIVKEVFVAFDNGTFLIPSIARELVWISLPGGGSKVSQQAGWNDF